VPVPRITRFALTAFALLAFSPVACGRARAPEPSSTALDVQVFRDTSGAVTLHVEPPPAARVWLRGVAIARPPAIDAPLPAAEPGTAPTDTAPPPALPFDPRLKSPILKSASPLSVPTARGRGSEAVELDVQVSEAGDVTDVRWAAGSEDAALVAAASACARSMRFHPALLGGKPVSVWCRQRFEFPVR
jgi:TonB family protein